MIALDDLPGWELIEPGLSDVKEGRRTPLACLVGIADFRFRRAGVISETVPRPTGELERERYALLLRQPEDAYASYQALMRRLCRFERALDARVQAGSRQ